MMLNIKAKKSKSNGQQVMHMLTLSMKMRKSIITLSQHIAKNLVVKSSKFHTMKDKIFKSIQEKDLSQIKRQNT